MTGGVWLNDEEKGQIGLSESDAESVTDAAFGLLRVAAE